MPRAPGTAPLGLILLLLLAASGAAARAEEPRTWNPHGKESPEPYGYDVATAPDLPLGHVNPEDPPATLDLPRPVDPLRAVLDVVTSVDRSSYSWFGTILVTADVSSGGSPVLGCDSVAVVSAANPRVRAELRDDGVSPDATAGDGRYSGRFEIGAGEGEARPTGTYAVTAHAYRGADSGSDASANFSLYSVRRWTGITTTDLADVSDDYTAFFVTASGGGYHHEIRDFGLVRQLSVTNAQIRIPILPAVNAISNLSVSGSGVSNVQALGNVIAFDCDLSAGTVKRVTIEFDAPSDLAAAFIDRYQTGDIALRDFRNGYMIWNRYISTAILGSGFSTPHGPGCIVDLHATDLVTGDSHTLDCMERVAVHLDDQADNDGTGTYQSNIKWGGDALSWFESGDLQSLVFRFASGGNYGLQTQVAVDRRVEFYAEARYFHQRYDLTNIDVAPHDFDFVWGREQWLYGSAPGSNRENRDRGLLPDDPTNYGGEHRFTAPEVAGNWFAAFDESSNYAIGVLLPQESEVAMPTYVHLLCEPALGNFTGEYPIAPAGSCPDMENLFFEKQLGVLSPSESASYEFFQWGGYAQDRNSLTQLLWEDAGSVVVDPVAVDDPSIDLPLGLPFGDGRARPRIALVSPNPFTTSTELSLVLPSREHVSLRIYDVQGRLVTGLFDGVLGAGRHLVRWDGQTRSGARAAAGSYLIRVESEGVGETVKAVLGR